MLFFKSAILQFSHVLKHLNTKKSSNGSNFGWPIQEISINQKVGGRRFVEGLYQALLPFRLAHRNVSYKAKRKLSLISGYKNMHLRNTWSQDIQGEPMVIFTLEPK